MPGSVEEWMELTLQRDTAKKLADEMILMFAKEQARTRDLQKDMETLKNEAEKMARELSIQRGRKEKYQKDIIELQLVIVSNNKVMGDLRETCTALGNLANSHKESIFELTASLTSSQLEAKSKMAYIDKYMKPLKDDNQAKHHMAMRAEDIIARLYERIMRPGCLVWSQTELIEALNAVTREVDDES